MASVLLKSLKFTRILNGRLSFSCVKPYRINKAHCIRSYKQARHTKTYATAAYKFAPVEESVVKNDSSTSDFITDVESVDRELTDIDFIIKRKGRIQLKNVHKIYSSINNKEMTTSTHGLYLIRSCKYCYDMPPSERVKLVNQIWNKYQELGIQFDVSHYNALLDVHINNGFNFDPADILASMEDNNIEPNKATYLLIMKKYCLDGNIGGASEILVYMKEKGLPVDEKVFNYLIEGHLKNQDFTGAQDMIEVMKTSDLQPTAETHAILACGYAATGEKDKMMSCLKQCQEQISVGNYLKVIVALADSENHQHIDDVLSLIKNFRTYEQELINASIELFHKGHIEVAYKLSVAAWNPDFRESVNIFVKQLIKVGKPVSDVLNFCERIVNEGLQDRILMVAARAAAEYKNLDLAFPLFEKMLENGHYLRCGNFWPLITSSKDTNDVWSILKKMSELGVPADFTTYFEKIYPTLQVINPVDILENVKNSGQVVETAADALFLYCCKTGNIDNAARLTEMHDIKVNNKMDADEFVDNIANLKREELNKYLKVLNYILMGREDYSHHNDIQGRVLAALILRKPLILEELLNRYQDLKFSPHTLRICEQELLRKNPARLSYLRKISDLNLQKRNLIKEENMSDEEEKKYLQYLQDERIPCRPFLTQRLLFHIRTRNVTRVSELLTLFDELNLTPSPVLLSNLMVMHCMAADLEKATMVLDKLKNDFPDFKLDMTRCLEYVMLLMRHGKFEESAEALKNFSKDLYITDTNRDQLFKTVKKFNMILCDIEDIEYVKKMQNLLMPLADRFSSKKIFLENAIHFYLQRNNVPEAFEEFKKVILSHRTPIYLNFLLKKCINQDEKVYLQKVIDLTTNYVGKSHAMLELAVAFIETFNREKAVKIIENLGQETDPKVLESICQTLGSQNKLHELEQMIEMTRSLAHVDTEKLYQIAFKACAERGDFKRAKELFDILKTQIPQPKQQTVRCLEELLKKNGQPHSLDLPSKSVDPGPLALENTKAFMEHLEARNTEGALKELSSLKKGYIRTLSIKTLTDLVDLCLETNNVYELSLNVQAMSYIIENANEVLTPLLEKYSEAGDVEKFVSIKNFMPDFSLMKIGFNSNYCKAYIASGQYENLLSELEAHVDKKNKLFSTIAFEELLKFPELSDRCFKLALKCLESNYNLPMACVWAHYFTTENFEKADEMFKKYTIAVDRIENVVLKSIKENENVSLAQKFIELVKSLSLRPRHTEKAYGAAIDLMVTKGMYEEAAALVVDSEKQNLLLHKYYLSTLVTLKNALEKENKPVPFSIQMDASIE